MLGAGGPSICPSSVVQDQFGKYLARVKNYTSIRLHFTVSFGLTGFFLGLHVFSLFNPCASKLEAWMGFNLSCSWIVQDRFGTNLSSLKNYTIIFGSILLFLSA